MGRHPVRCNAHEDDAGGSDPRCAGRRCDVTSGGGDTTADDLAHGNGLARQPRFIGL
jgi:hypothetical protein